MSQERSATDECPLFPCFDVLPVFQPSLSESFPALLSLRARSWNMKKSRYTEEQIAFALKQAETGTPVAEVIRRMGVSEQTFYRWKKVYAVLVVGRGVGGN